MAMSWLNQERTTAQPRTTNRRLSAIRNFARWCGADLTEFSDYRPPTAAPTQPHPLVGGLPDLRQLITATDAIHYRAHLALQGLCGLRVAEAIETTVELIDFENSELTVNGKGAKQRIVPISTEAWALLLPAIARVKCEASPIVGLSDSGARSFIRELGMRVLHRSIASHDLRATFATHVYEQTLDIRLVQALLGHSNIHTTETYILVKRANMRKAVEFN